MKRKICAAMLFSMVLMLSLAPISLADQGTPPSWDDLGRQVLAHNDGWASFSTGTTGGSQAVAPNVHTVTNRSELVNALGGNNATNSTNATPKIIYVKGTINLSVDDNNLPLTEAGYKDPGYDLQAYLTQYDPATWGKQPVTGPLEEARARSQKNQASRIVVFVGSNTTIVGVGENARIIGGNLYLKKVDNVIIRNLNFQDAYDYFPQWDPNDGSTGNWNSQYDNLTLEGATHIWVDHCDFSDLFRTDDQSPVYFGHTYQHHDGLLDVTKQADYITVSYNHFYDHDKVGLVGSSDSATTDNGHLKVTFHHNFYENTVQRMPRVRFGQVHVYNNYFKENTNSANYPFLYIFGVGISSKIYSQNNYIQLNRNADPASIISVFKGTTFFDAGTLLNGAPVDLVGVYNAAHSSAPLTQDVGWTPTLFLKIDLANKVPNIVRTQAGKGILTSRDYGQS